MSLKNIQLAAINPINHLNNLFDVVVHSDDGHQIAMFDCTGESDAIKLRRAAEYRPGQR